jgi:glycosyltransferase involved in cell wall biosynthesis
MVITNIGVVTIIHNQSENLPKLLDSYSTQTKQPLLYCFVLDRCSDNSYELIQSFKVNSSVEVTIVESNTSSGFGAGFCRDIGVDIVHSFDSDATILFIDGDCIPTSILFEQVQDSASKSDIIIVARMNQIQGTDNYMDDLRVAAPWLDGIVFSRGKNVVIKNMELARSRQLTWSCSLAMSQKAIRTCQDINESIYGIRRVFANVFDGEWGGEDDFVGLTAMLFGLVVTSIDPTHHVKHLWHIPRTNNNIMTKTKIEYEKLKELAILRNSPGLHFTTLDPDIHRKNYMQKLMNSNL